MIRKVIVLSCLFAIIGCDAFESPVATTADEIAIQAAAGGNVLYSANGEFPWQAPPTFNPCEGELVEIEGVVHVAHRQSSDGSGGFHETFHVNARPGDLVGTGLTSGATYRVWSTEQSIWKQVEPGVFQALHPGRLRLSSPDGEVEGFWARFNFFVRKEAGQPPEIHIGVYETGCI